jgi:hypothetical protein
VISALAGGGLDCEVVVVSERIEPLRNGHTPLTITPGRTFAEVPEPYAVVVLGGVSRRRSVPSPTKPAELPASGVGGRRVDDVGLYRRTAVGCGVPAGREARHHALGCTGTCFARSVRSRRRSAGWRTAG